MIDVVESLIQFLRSKFTVAEVGYDLTKIYPDHPRADLSDSSYPRMHVVSVAAFATDAQIGRPTQDQEFSFQFNIYTRPKIIVDIGGEKFEGAKLTKRILSDALEVFRKYHDDPFLRDAGLYGYQVGNILGNFPEDPETKTQQVAFEASFKRTVV